MKRKESSLRTAIQAGLLAIPLLGSALAAGLQGQVLYRFQGGSDGSSPMAVMIADSAGNLYGTTNLGGGSGNCAGGCGTVFQLAPPVAAGGAWSETVLYRFQGGADGMYPEAPLIADAAGNLYGTTAAGGTGNCVPEQIIGCGTVFELAPPSTAGGGWTISILYSFRGVPKGSGDGDAADPNGIVFDQHGNIFGFAYSGAHCTTDETGTYCNGGAFALKRPASVADAWTENMIFRFHGPSGNPAGPVFDKAGRLYGTAPGGTFGFGGVFRLTPPGQPDAAWKQSAVYEFHGSDGAFPEPGLVFDKAGNLYGAGLGTPQGTGNGDAFELTPTQGGGWSESVIYDFTPIGNGYVPNGGPILGANGHLYATAAEGGAFGMGVVYELTPPSSPGGAWSEEVLYSFSAGNGSPTVGLTFGKGGALYGTTTTGGGGTCANGAGCGTVFAVVP